MQTQLRRFLGGLTLMASAAAWGDQAIELDPKPLVPGAVTYVRAYYSTDDAEANRTGVAFSLYWDSTALSFYEVAGIHPAPFQWQSHVQTDTEDRDGDARTDSYLTLSWYDPAGSWPGVLEQPAKLFYIGFSSSSDLSGETPLNLVPVSSSPTADGSLNALIVESATLSTEHPTRTYRLTVSKTGTGAGRVTGDGIDCGADCAEDYPENSTLSLTATAETGSRFAGWDGACTGEASCDLSIMAPTTVTAQFTFDGSESCQSAPLVVSEPRLQGAWLFRSETSITTNGPVILEATADARFEAAQTIRFNPGFQVETGARLVARITPVDCDL